MCPALHACTLRSNPDESESSVHNLMACQSLANWTRSKLLLLSCLIVLEVKACLCVCEGFRERVSTYYAPATLLDPPGW